MDQAPEGAEILRDLLRTADVWVQNFRPGTIERMGFGEDAVRALREDIIYVSISGFVKQGRSLINVYTILLSRPFRDWLRFKLTVRVADQK